MKSISLWHQFSVISMILCQPCWIQLIYHRKSLRSKLIRDVSKASSTVIEEWWINVHAFDLAGLVLSNRFPFSRSVPFPTMASFSYSLSLRSILFSFCISYCYYISNATLNSHYRRHQLVGSSFAIFSIRSS